QAILAGDVWNGRPFKYGGHPMDQLTTLTASSGSCPTGVFQILLGPGRQDVFVDITSILHALRELEASSIGFVTNGSTRQSKIRTTRILLTFRAAPETRAGSHQTVSRQVN